MVLSHGHPMWPRHQQWKEMWHHQKINLLGCQEVLLNAYRIAHKVRLNHLLLKTRCKLTGNHRWTRISWIVSAKEWLFWLWKPWPNVWSEHLLVGYQEMLKANNNYKAFYQVTMEDLHDSDIPKYRQVDKKRFKKYFIECYAETSGNFSAYNIRERACHTEEAREENVHLPYEHYLTTGSSVRRNMMQFEGEMEEI